MCNRRFTASLETPTVQICLLSPFTAHPTLSSTCYPCAKMSLQRAPQIDPRDMHTDITWTSAPAVTLLQRKQCRLPKFQSPYAAPELFCAALHSLHQHTALRSQEKPSATEGEIALTGLAGPSRFPVVVVVLSWVCSYRHIKFKGKKNHFWEKKKHGQSPIQAQRWGDAAHCLQKSLGCTISTLQHRFYHGFSAYGRLFKK